MLQITKQNLSIGAICSKKSYRLALQCLCVDPIEKTITATDSYRLLTMKTGECEDTPIINEKPAIIPTGKILIPADTAKSTKSKIKKVTKP